MTQASCKQQEKRAPLYATMLCVAFTSLPNVGFVDWYSRLSRHSTVGDPFKGRNVFLAVILGNETWDRMVAETFELVKNCLTCRKDGLKSAEASLTFQRHFLVCRLPDDGNVSPAFIRLRIPMERRKRYIILQHDWL